MSAITLLDGSLKLNIFYEQFDRSFDDDICLCFTEDCPEDEKIFKADETSIYLTPEEAALVVLELNRAISAYRQDTSPKENDS
jgi:hypothetical protein